MNIKIIIISFLCLILISCDLSEHKATYIENKYLLRQMKTELQTHGKLNGSFFLGIGDINGEINQNNIVTFCFNDDGIFKFATIPLTYLKIRIDSSANIPYMSSRILDSASQECVNCYTKSSTDYLYYGESFEEQESRSKSIKDKGIITIFCKEKDLPTNIKIGI